MALVGGRNSTGCWVDDGNISISSKLVLFCESVSLVAIGDGSMVENSSSLDDCSDRGEDGRSVGVRGEASDGVREEGRAGTVLNAATLSVMDGGRRGSSLARVGDGNAISGWVAIEIGRKVTSGPEPGKRKQDG